MIAVRGTIRHKGDRRSPTSSPTPTSTPSTTARTANTNTSTTNNTSNTNSNFNPLDIEAGEWIWTGHWAFGSLPPAEVLENVGSHHKKKKPPAGVRPFVYKFQMVKDAKDVIVPSSLLYMDDDDGEEENEEGGGGAEEKGQRTKQENDEGQEGKGRTNNKVPNESIKSQDTEASTKKENTATVQTQEEQTLSKKNEHNEKDKGDTKTKPSSFIHDETKDTKKSQKIDQESQIVPTDTAKSNVSSQQQQGESFASTGEGSKFTDGGIKYPRRCPIGGCWKGYFENVSVSYKDSTCQMLSFCIRNFSQFFFQMFPLISCILETKRSNVK